MQNNTLRYLYLITIFFLYITGFVQIPILKHYYIADIYDFSWLSEFYVTHYIHYFFAVILIIIAFFSAFEYFLIGRNKIMVSGYTIVEKKGQPPIVLRKQIKLTISGYIRIIILSGICITGALLVIKNISGSNLLDSLIKFLDLAHLSLVITFLITSLYCAIFKKKWAA
jgi:hypothetical protein